MSLVNYTTTNTAKIELPSAVLAHLIEKGWLHGDNCRCLDNQSKQVLWRSLLLSSANVEQQ